MSENTELTVKRRAFLLGALLAPLARPLAALGIQAYRPWSEFTIKIANDEWTICLSKDGEVDSVTYSKGQRVFRMFETQTGMGCWSGEKPSYRQFLHRGDKVIAAISFRVIDANTINVGHVSVNQLLEPIQAVKVSTKQRDVEIDWIGGNMQSMSASPFKC